MNLTHLFIYPIKGCRGTAVKEGHLDAQGLIGDRRFMVVQLDGKFLSQRTHPQMALIEPALTRNQLVVTAANRANLVVPLSADHPTPMSVDVWSSAGLQAEDCGDAAGEWFGAILETPVRLVRIGSAYHRAVKPSEARPGDVVAFADAFPFLVISDASLADLNDRIVASGTPALPMNRFRPNLVISGCSAFAEDSWHRFRIGDIVFRAAGKCSRCIVTTTDQSTGVRGKEPLKTLATYRRDTAQPSDVVFGQNLIHETKSGCLRIGDKIHLLTENSVEPE